MRLDLAGASCVTQQTSCFIASNCALLRLPSAWQEAILNAITTIAPDTGIGKHIARLERVIELTMQLIEVAAADAIKDKAEPQDLAGSRPRRPDPGQFFLRLTASMRQDMAQQARFVAGLKQAAEAKSPAAPSPPSSVAPKEPVAQTAPAKAATPCKSRQQDYMNTTSVTQSLSPYADALANQK